MLTNAYLPAYRNFRTRKADRAPTVAIRGMSAEQVASTRLLMHLAGIVGAAASTSEWADKASLMVNMKGVEMNINETGGNVTDAFLRGARADAAAIRRLTNRNHETMALGLHLALFAGVGSGGHSRWVVFTNCNIGNCCCCGLSVTAVLSSTNEWQQALMTHKRIHLPLKQSGPGK